MPSAAASGQRLLIEMRRSEGNAAAARQGKARCVMRTPKCLAAAPIALLMLSPDLVAEGASLTVPLACAAHDFWRIH